MNGLRSLCYVTFIPDVQEAAGNSGYLKVTVTPPSNDFRGTGTLIKLLNERLHKCKIADVNGMIEFLYVRL